MCTQLSKGSTAERLREARKSAGLTQKQVSTELNIPLRTIEDWERGIRTPPEWLTKMLIMILSDPELISRIKSL